MLREPAFQGRWGGRQWRDMRVRSGRLRNTNSGAPPQIAATIGKHATYAKPRGAGA